MWFGSYNGLHKHEGTSIKVYKKNNKDSTSLSSNEMHSVFEDRLGFIWVGTTGGLDKLNPTTGTIKHYKLKSPTRTDDWIGYIVTIFQDDEDNIWVRAEAGLFILNYNSENYHQVLENEKSGKGIPSSSLIYKSVVTTKEGLWMYAPGYLMFYDFKSHQFLHKYNNPLHKKIFELPSSKNQELQSDLCIDSSKNLYFINNGSTLIKYNIITEKLDSFAFSFPENAWHCCFSIASDYKGNVWIGFRYGGLLFFNSSSQKFTAIRYKDANSLVQSDYIYSLNEDYLKRMWVTTNNGIFIINYYDSAIQQKNLSYKKDILNIDYPSALISQDEDGTIYAPYFAGGLFTYNVFNTVSRYFALPDTSVKSLGYVFTEEKNKTYIACKGTLLKADVSANKIKLSLPDSKLYKLLAATPSKVVWVFKYNEHAIYFKKGDGNIYYYNGIDSLEKIQGNGFTRQACVSVNNEFFWFLSEDGDLIKRNLLSLKMDTIPLTKKLRTLHFSYTNTRDIADDGNGNIWITSQNGLIKYNLQNETVAVYSTVDGLLHDFSFTICVDSKKRLWVGSMGGVNLYNAERNIFTNVFALSPDKLSNYFGSSLEGKDGHIYFLFNGNLVSINPDKISENKIEERLLQLNEVQINGKSVNFSTNILSSLSYEQNRIYFRFGLLEFVQTEKIKYYYHLEGLDKNWIDLSNHSEITFNSLQPGNYTLHVKAIDALGNEVKKQLTIPFSINPPFWKTWWFLLLLIFSLGLLIYWFIKWREKNIKTIAAEKLKVQKLHADNYKNKLELEQIINYFSSSLIDKNTVDDVLWDVAKNLIGRLGFVDCMVYLWNSDKTKMVQKAGFGPKDSIEEINKLPFDVLPGQGLVGYVMQTKEPLLIADTSKDDRYRSDDLIRLSEITVPIIYNKQLIGIIDSEHPQKNFYTQQHVQLLTTIATLTANKIKSIEADNVLQQTKIEMYTMNEQLSKAKLEALRSQMNPHFIFNSLNAIQECILTNNVDAAYEYLSKFSKLQRMVLNNSQLELIPLSSEIEMLQLYLSLESLRFSKSFYYSINTECHNVLNEIMVPSLITQPIVENALWHGLRSKEGEKKLEIIYRETEEEIIVIIDDNGIGRIEAAYIKKKKLGSDSFASKGTILLQQRLNVLSQQLKAEIKLITEDKKDMAGNSLGTKVTISFPSNLENAE